MVDFDGVGTALGYLEVRFFSEFARATRSILTSQPFAIESSSVHRLSAAAPVPKSIKDAMLWTHTPVGIGSRNHQATTNGPMAGHAGFGRQALEA
jgi:hypothetical protein